MENYKIEGDVDLLKAVQVNAVKYKITQVPYSDIILLKDALGTIIKDTLGVEIYTKI